nr:hypothetical protein [Tanacetum cinerariifolium]
MADNQTRAQAHQLPTITIGDEDAILNPKATETKLEHEHASPVIVEPLRIELPFLDDQFQEDPPEDPPKVLMADDRIMAELLRAPTEGYEDAIVIPK